MGKTITLIASNNKDVLPQAEWVKFIRDVDSAVYGNTHRLHFSGTSLPTSEWQNAAWVFEINFEESLILQDRLEKYARTYKPDSIVWIENNKTTYINSG